MIKEGTITLCQICHHAIQYRSTLYMGTRVSLWEHTEAKAVTGPYHPAEPMKEVGA